LVDVIVDVNSLRIVLTRTTTSVARGEPPWRVRVVGPPSSALVAERRATLEFEYVWFACFTDVVRGKNVFSNMLLGVDTLRTEA
jgi:hypothetical protein